jgi:hypothetical protein
MIASRISLSLAGRLSYGLRSYPSRTQPICWPAQRRPAGGAEDAPAPGSRGAGFGTLRFALPAINGALGALPDCGLPRYSAEAVLRAVTFRRPSEEATARSGLSAAGRQASE